MSNVAPLRCVCVFKENIWSSLEKKKRDSFGAGAASNPALIAPVPSSPQCITDHQIRWAPFNETESNCFIHFFFKKKKKEKEREKICGNSGTFLISHTSVSYGKTWTFSRLFIITHVNSSWNLQKKPCQLFPGRTLNETFSARFHILAV